MNLPPGHRPIDGDATADLLRQALAAEAADVHPDPQALHDIQQRTTAAESSASPAGRRLSTGASRTGLGGRPSWVLGALGAGVATAAVITAFVVVGDRSGNPSGTPAAGGVHMTRHAGVFDPNAPAADQVTLYYLGTGGSQRASDTRLFPEPHTVAAGGDSPAMTAMHEFLTSTSIDPDYSSGWPAGVDVRSITETNGGTIIDLDGAESFLTVHPDKSDSRLDPQLMRAIWALLATAGVDHQSGAGRELTGTWLRSGSVTIGPFAPPSDDDVRAWVSITSPVEGQAVDSPVTVTGSANVFEANVNWELLDADGKLVDSGNAMAGFTEWKDFTVDLGQLAPGTYTIRAFESSPANGRATSIDDKTFTVR